MSAFFLVGSIVSVVMLAAVGAVGAVDARYVQVFVWLIPAVAAGFLLSRRLNRWMTIERLRLTGLLQASLGTVLLLLRLLLGA